MNTQASNATDSRGRMRAYQATALIDAAPAQIWRVLTDTAAWPNSGPLAAVIFTSIPNLGPSFQQFADGLKQQTEAGAR